MSLKAELETWAAALKAYDAEDFSMAMDEFNKIADSSKIHWNIGIILATLGDHEQAVESFYTATQLDQYFTVAYQQAGVSNFMLGRYDAASKDFEDALLYMRGNQTINYEQLGLDFRLYSAEIYFNVGLAKIYQGQVESGLQDLRQAQQEKTIPEHSVIDDAIREQGRDYNVFSVPVGVLFRPAAHKLKNLATRDYMGKAILVAATDANDAYTTFSGITRLQRGQTPTGAPLDATHPLSRSASVSALPIAGEHKPLPTPQRITRSNTVSTPRPTPDVLSRPRPPTRGLTITRNNTITNSPTNSRQSPARRQNSLPQLPESEPLDLDSGRTSPSSDPQVRTPPTSDRIKSLAATELYDEYYKSAGAYDDDIPELPPIGAGAGAGKKIEVWAKKATGAPPPPSAMLRQMSISGKGIGGKGIGGGGGGGMMRRPSIGSRSGGLTRSASRAGSVMDGSRYDDESDAGSFYDMSKIRIKVHVGNLTRGMSVTPDQTYPDFILSLRDKFPELGDTLNVRFKDEDGDMLSMQDEGDFEAAVDVARVMAKGRSEGKLEIWVD